MEQLMYHIHIMIYYTSTDKIKTEIHLKTKDWLDVEALWEGYKFDEHVDIIDHMVEDIVEKDFYQCTCIKDDYTYAFEIESKIFKEI